MWYATCTCSVVKLWAVNLSLFCCMQLTVVLEREGVGRGYINKPRGGICMCGKATNRKSLSLS